MPETRFPLRSHRFPAPQPSPVTPGALRAGERQGLCQTTHKYIKGHWGAPAQRLVTTHSLLPGGGAGLGQHKCQRALVVSTSVF